MVIAKAVITFILILFNHLGGSDAPLQDEQTPQPEVLQPQRGEGSPP